MKYKRICYILTNTKNENTFGPSWDDLIIVSPNKYFVTLADLKT